MILKSLHKDLDALYKVGAVSKMTLREFDAVSSSPVWKFSGAEIKQLRESLHFSQPVFAYHLRTTALTLRKWAQFDTHPAGPASKICWLVN